MVEHRARGRHGHIGLLALVHDLLAARVLERLRHDLAHPEDDAEVLGDALGVRIARQRGREVGLLGPAGQLHVSGTSLARADGLGIVLPHLVSGERQHRRQHAHEHLDDVHEHGLRSAAARRVGRLGVHAVLRGVHVNGRKVAHDVVVHRAVHHMELVFVVGTLHVDEQVPQAHHGPLVDGSSAFQSVTVCFRSSKSAQTAQQEAHRVADAAVRLARALEDLVADVRPSWSS